MLKTLSLVAAAVGLAATLSAQTAAPGPDTFKVGYYANANSGEPDGTKTSSKIKVLSNRTLRKKE